MRTLLQLCHHGVRAAGAAIAIACGRAGTALAFEETFDQPTVIEEAPSAGASSSAGWWLNSGGRAVFSGGLGRTLQGELPRTDPWAAAYGWSREADYGLHPQNLFRLLTQETGTEHRQEVSIRIVATNLSAAHSREAFNGVFLDARRVDEANAYVAGVRFDGQAVIKKQRHGVFHTLGATPVFAGRYDATTAPTLLPQGRWFSLRLTIENVDDATRLVLEIEDTARAGQWLTVLDVLDAPGGKDGPPLGGPGRSGIRADFMDLELEDYLAFLPPDGVRELPGFHDAEQGRVTLRTRRTPDAPLDAFAYGAPGAAAHAVLGRWQSSSCADTIGLYDPGLGAFLLSLENAAGPAEIEFAYGPVGRGWLPLAGDWNGDGQDTVGLYDPQTSSFFLTNRFAPGDADVAFAFGPAGFGFVPLAGDWDGDGVDTVGLYDPATGNFFLSNRFAGGNAEIVVPFGPAGGEVEPVTGDWDGDGTDTVGVFRAIDGVLAARNTHQGGPADRVDRLPGSAQGARPLAGRFESTCSR